MSDAPAGLWVALVALLALSAFFSASETALFSLEPGQRGRSGPRVRRLLGRPRDLLVTVLLANLLVNLAFFAFAMRLEPAEHGRGSALVGLGSLASVLVFGEILPKTFGLRAAPLVARACAVPLTLLVGAFGPPRRFLTGLLERTSELLGSAAGEERPITPEMLAEVIERSASRGVLADSEADFSAEILRLGEVRVREIMTPRVDLVLLDLSGAGRAESVAAALAKRLTWLPVIDADPDSIVGRVKLRDLLNQRDRPVKQLVMPVAFVPEVAGALDALETLRGERSAEAMVVDEWGGTAGVVTLEDIFEEIVGELRVEGEVHGPAAIPLGEGRFRVAGGLSIRDWNEEFGRRVVPTEFETVGGFVTALLGRMPRQGDVARHGNLELVVEELRGRRIHSVDVRVVAEDDAAAGAARASGRRPRA